MTDKKKQFIEAICDQYGFDYPESYGDDQWYQDVLDSCNFKNGCYINGNRFCLKDIVDLADSIGLLDDED